MESKNNIYKQADQKLIHKYREHFDSCQMGAGLGGWGEIGERIEKYRLAVTE